MIRNDFNASTIARLAFWLMLAMLTIRLISLGLYPLMDTTEARYGEIARIMAETGNWITPQIDYDVPFWGKPPLYAWMTALSFKAFGVSEFTARLPHFLAGLGILGLVWQFARHQMNQTKAALSALVMSTTAVFIVSIGAVMTDTVLLLSVTLALVSFWKAWHRSNDASPIWGYLFFVGLAIGLLAKGLTALILTGIPVFLWCLPQLRILQLWHRLPWITGTLLMLAIALPWYLLAEKATPGFLDYFIGGEHFKRFLVSGWEGDLYGSTHPQPKGTIWLLWLYGATPWNIVLPLLYWKNRQTNRAVDASEKRHSKTGKSGKTGKTGKTGEWRLFLLLWMLTPMLFFSLTGNILWTYILPGIPAMALLTGDYLGDAFQKRENSEPNRREIRRWIIIPSSVLMIVLPLICVGMKLGLKESSKGLLAPFNRAKDVDAALVYWPKRPFSGQFYSQGQARVVEDRDKLVELIDDDSRALYLVMKSKHKTMLPQGVQDKLQLITVSGEHQLWTSIRNKPVL